MNHIEDTFVPTLIGSLPITALVHEIFGTGPLVLAVALLGSWFGLAALPAGKECKNWPEALKRFGGNLMLVAGSTISAGFVVPLFLSRFPGCHYPIAFFGALAIVYNHEKLLKLTGKVLEKKAGEI